MENTRPVEVTERKYKQNGNGFDEIKRRGKFHQWGVRQNKSRDGEPPTMQSVAIVEFDNGKVAQAYPESIRFLDAST